MRAFRMTRNLRLAPWSQGRISVLELFGRLVAQLAKFIGDGRAITCLGEGFQL